MTTAPPSTPTPRWDALLWGGAGLLTGLATARTLYQAQPRLFSFLDTYFGVALLALILFGVGVAAYFWLHPQAHGRLLTVAPLPALLLLWPLLALPGVDWVLGPALLIAALLVWLGLAYASLTNLPAWANHPLWLPLGVGLLVVTLYLLTLVPTVGQADTFEFQVNAIRLGVSHGSGYPAYILLAKLFSLLPIGPNPAWRVNLSSAVFGVLAALMVFALVRQAHGGRAAASVAALTLGTAYVVWSRAVEAEVYTLNLLFIAIILWLLVQLPNNPTRWLPWLGLAIGVNTANHLTTGLLAPAVLLGLGLLIATPAGRKVPLRTWAASGGLLLLGLAFYLYLPIRWPAINNGEIMTWEIFTRFISGQEAHGALRPLAFLQDLSRYPLVWRKAVEAFGPLGMLLSVVGLIELTRSHWRIAAYSLLIWLVYSYFGLSFYVPDPDYTAFLMPAHLMQAFWLGVGLHWLLNRLPNAPNSPWPPLAVRAALVGVALLFFPVAAVQANYQRVQQPFLWPAYHLGQAMLDYPLAPNATILADSQKFPPLFYLQVAEGRRPDLDIVVLPLEETYRAELDARLANGQTVYLGRYLPNLGPFYSLNSVGPLVQPSSQPTTELPATSTRLPASHLPLAAFIADPTHPAGQTWPLTLYWQPTEPLTGNLLVNLRLVDATGAEVQRWPGVVPVAQMYPTNAWRTSEVIADHLRPQLDRALPPGDYSVQVALLPPFTADQLSDWVTFSNLTITPPTTAPEITHPLVIHSGPLTLMGAELPTQATPGSSLTVRLHWQLTAPLTADPPNFTLWANNQLIADLPPIPDDWPLGTVFTMATALTAPTDGGSLNLALQADQPLRCGWLTPPAATCPLPVVMLSGTALPTNAVNYDNQIALLDVQVPAETAAPGEVVIVTAEWLALSPMRENYTIFVQFIGPDGLPHGQVDVWPAQGTLPTSAMTPGQQVSDRFEVRLNADAPPGDYQLAIGWYLLQTLQRLPVVDTDGQPIDDKLLTRAFTIP